MMASKVDQLIEGRLKPRNLIVNVPPGGTKTEFFSVHLPAYQNLLIATRQLKRFRNFNISFSDDLLKRNSRRTRHSIAAPEHRALWPCRFASNRADAWAVAGASRRV